MDAAYDAEPIRQHSRSLGHVPLIDTNPRRDKALAEQLRTEARRLQHIGFQLPEQVRYNERTAGERVRTVAGPARCRRSCELASTCATAATRES